MRLMKIAVLAATVVPLSSHASLGAAPNIGSGAGAATMLRAMPQFAAATSAAQTAQSAQAAAATQSPPATTAAPYTVRQSLDPNGVTTREYVLPTNVVFAVTWEGPIRPDMTALLGQYFPNYVNAGRSRTLGSGPLVAGDGTFRIESGGRLGHFYGVAWLPGLMPTGVRPSDLQ